MSDIEQIAAWLAEAKSAVAFTGAGISTESGIPDFRSPGGVWATNQPVYYNDFVNSEDARYEYWRQKSLAHEDFAGSKPNVGHEVLAKWESQGRLRGVVTQNIDGLHQDAGSRRVVELHGTARHVSCLDCDALYEAGEMVQRFLDEDKPPRCDRCGGITKHATVSFGQMLPIEAIEQAGQWSEAADVFFAMGSSLVVYPAAEYPKVAKRQGARLVIVNRDPTDQDAQADAVIHQSIGETLAAIDACL